jgi:hypothetical protein
LKNNEGLKDRTRQNQRETTRERHTRERKNVEGLGEGKGREWRDKRAEINKSVQDRIAGGDRTYRYTP